MKSVAVLGTGMAAYGATERLAAEGVPFRCYDRNAYPGGHTATFFHPGGIVFDDGPHVSFTKDPRIQELLARNVGGDFREIRARINNHWRGHWIPHPVQCHLHGLPTELVVDIIRDFVASGRQDEPVVSNYAEWLEASYGRTFAHTFPMEYGLKYHTTPMSNLTTDWLGPRMYRPSLDELVRGALSTEVADVHYVTSFRYPNQGGFAAYMRPFFERPEVALEHEVVAIDPAARTIAFANGQVTEYSHVISSIPLPDLVPLVRNVPPEVTRAAGRLAFTTVLLVNLVVDRDDISDAHVSYFYDRDIPFPRVTFPHLFSPSNVPPGCGAVQVETYFSEKYRPLEEPPASLIDLAIEGLVTTGILREDDQILFREARVSRYANVIYDLDRADALATVHGFLDEVGVAWCGRYGAWDHAWTDEAFVSGERAAERVLSGSG